MRGKRGEPNAETPLAMWTTLPAGCRRYGDSLAGAKSGLLILAARGYRLVSHPGAEKKAA